MITERDLMVYDSLPGIEYNREVARLLDRRIYAGYRLTPNNFVAHDIRFGKHEFKGGKYTDEQKDRFLHHLKKLENTMSMSRRCLWTYSLEYIRILWIIVLREITKVSQMRNTTVLHHKW